MPKTIQHLFLSLLFIPFSLSCINGQITPKDSKPFDNKTIVCFGASSTERGNWVELMPDIVGGDFINIGIGGATMSRRKQFSDLEKAWDNFAFYKLSEYITKQDYKELDEAVEYIYNNDGHDYKRVIEIIKLIDFTKVDIIILFYGGNDFSNANDIGEFGSYDVNSLIGSMNYGIKNILSVFPHLKILFITPSYRWLSEDGVKDTDNTPNAIGLFTKDYTDAIIKNAEYWHLPAINMMKDLGVNKYNHHLYFLDGSHFNKEGGKLFANRLAAWMVSIYKY